MTSWNVYIFKKLTIIVLIYYMKHTINSFHVTL
jgi:hypothetical protein